VISLLSRWLPPVVWAGVIFALSAQPNPYRALPPAFPAAFYNLLGAVMHTLEYTLLSFLLARALVWQSCPRYTRLWFAALLAFGFGLSDEVHQLFVPGRAFQWTDLGLDGLGSGLGMALYLHFCKLKNH
jgi:VanZ family protein